MARDVIVNFDTQAQSFPGIFTPGKFRVSIQGSPVPDQDVDFGPVLFTGVAPGDYIAKVVRLGPDGLDLGAPAIAAFTVPVDSTLVAVPLTVTVSVADGVPV
jgi:hypothetical protein